MIQTTNIKDERVFTIELKSKGDLKNVSLGGNEKVFIEGSLGTLKRAQFVDDLVLEVIGTNGELRIDLAMNDLQKQPQGEVEKEDRGSKQ
jgi:hypothetical protein